MWFQLKAVALRRIQYLLILIYTVSRVDFHFLCLNEDRFRSQLNQRKECCPVANISILTTPQWFYGLSCIVIKLWIALDSAHSKNNSIERIITSVEPLSDVIPIALQPLLSKVFVHRRKARPCSTTLAIMTAPTISASSLIQNPATSTTPAATAQPRWSYAETASSSKTLIPSGRIAPTRSLWSAVTELILVSRIYFINSPCNYSSDRFLMPLDDDICYGSKFWPQLSMCQASSK